jgi:hypothetical protein
MNYFELASYLALIARSSKTEDYRKKGILRSMFSERRLS